MGSGFSSSEYLSKIEVDLPDLKTYSDNKVESYPFTTPDGKQFWLVDTPGLDDTVRDDSDILEDLANWLDASYRTGTKFHGLLYLHRIVDNRETSTGLKNLRMFKCICGLENSSPVALGTTSWDKNECQHR